MKETKIKYKSCMNCKWASCKNYGYDKSVCLSFIQDKYPKEEEE